MLKSVGVVDALGTYARLWVSNGHHQVGKERNYTGKEKTRISSWKVFRLPKKGKRKKSNDITNQKLKVSLTLMLL